MKSRIWSATCATFVLGVGIGLLAQESPASQSSSQSAAGKSVTITGCVGKAEQTATGTSGVAGAAATNKDAKFVLKDASKSPSSATGTAGAEGASATSASATEYKLDGDDAKLTPHVGHKVEITGTVDDKGASSSSSSASATASPSTSPSASASTSSTNTPTLKVDSVKMIASSCK